MFSVLRLLCLCASVYMCLVVTCWERADLLALVCGVLLRVCHFPIGILGQVWYLFVSIPELCTLTYFTLIAFKCRCPSCSENDKKKKRSLPQHSLVLEGVCATTNRNTVPLLIVYYILWI